MENVAIKGRGGNDVQHKNWKGKILRIWITIIRHGGLGHEVQESWPYLSNATPWPYELSHVKNEFSLVGLTALSCCCLLQTYKKLLQTYIKLFFKNATKNSGRFFMIIIIYFYFIITVSRSRLLSN